jgi:Anaphase-promoting complex, cyclosome, subunit 3
MGAPAYQDEVNPCASNDNENDRDVTNAVEGNDAGIVETYTSLIQQYLSVMCVHNAIFLAERLVATDRSSDSLYLLALCHHRSGSPQRALSVLDNCQDTSPNIQYLIAICCYELEDFGRAEEALLYSCRMEYRKMRNNTVSVTEPLAASSESMENWIVTASVSKNTLCFHGQNVMFSCQLFFCSLVLFPTALPAFIFWATFVGNRTGRNVPNNTTECRSRCVA